MKPIVYQIGGEVTSPKLVNSVIPEFTEEARKHKVQGVTTLLLVVDPEGNPQDIKVTRSAAEDAKAKNCRAAHGLDDKAIEAIKQYRFKPGMLDFQLI